MFYAQVLDVNFPLVNRLSIARVNSFRRKPWPSYLCGDINRFNNIVLIDEQLFTVKSLLEENEFLAILPTGFGKKCYFQGFCKGKNTFSAT